MAEDAPSLPALLSVDADSLLSEPEEDAVSFSFWAVPCLLPLANFLFFLKRPTMKTMMPISRASVMMEAVGAGGIADVRHLLFAPATA